MKRIIRIENFRKKLLKGDALIGAWMQIASSTIAELLSASNFDWIAIDMEHGAICANDLPDLFRAIELNDVLPIVRTRSKNEFDCRSALDAGAAGLIIPMVQSLEEVREIINFCSWPPTGRRGVGFSRSNLFGKNFEGYKQEAQKPIIIPMIENILAIKNLSQILIHTKIDAIFIGPYDLSASMGRAGDFTSPEFNNAIFEIKKICKENRVPVGIHVIPPELSELQQRISEGYQFIAYSTDAQFIIKSAKFSSEAQ